jgi:hypothetical protein
LLPSCGKHHAQPFAATQPWQRSPSTSLSSVWFAPVGALNAEQFVAVGPAVVVGAGDEPACVVLLSATTACETSPTRTNATKRRVMLGERVLVWSQMEKVEG